MSKPSSNLYSSRRHVVLSYFSMSTTCLSRNLIALHGFRWPPQLAYRFLIRCAPAEHNSIVLLRNQRAFHAPTEATALAPAAYACTSIRRLLAQLSKNMHLPGQAKRKKKVPTSKIPAPRKDGLTRQRSQAACQENLSEQHHLNLEQGLQQ